MLPESMAPPLPRYDEVKKFLEERGLIVRRVYEPPWEDPETGEITEPYWQVYVAKEEKVGDEMYAYILTMSDSVVSGGWDKAWELHAHVVESGWKALLEEKAPE